MNLFQDEIIFFILVCGRFLYSWKKFHVLFFPPHFNNSSIPVLYWKSLPHLHWTHFRNVFKYKFTFTFQFVEDFWRFGKQIALFSFPSTFQKFFHPCRIFKISSTFKKCILISNYLPNFSLWEMSVKLENFMLIFSFHILFWH